MILLDDDTKIDFEYDCEHWHDDAQKERDRKRDGLMKFLGYKIFRISTNRGYPKWETLEEGIEYLRTHKDKVLYVKIDDDGKVVD